jgi:tetratricopeptide (TPR) repeat protein
VALCTAGLIFCDIVGDYTGADALSERALALNPNLALAWLISGWVKVSLGDPDAAIERVGRAMRLSPKDPQMFSMQNAIACAHFVAGRYDEALSWAKTAMRERPNFVLPNCTAATSAALAGRLDEARKAIAHLRQIAPELTISNFTNVMSYLREEDFDRWFDGLRKAGLPE